MIVILGLIILVAAAIIGVAGVLGNGAHGPAHGFSVLNGDRHPAPDDGRGSRLLGHRSAARQDPATTPQALNGQPAPRFPPMSPAPAE